MQSISRRVRSGWKGIGLYSLLNQGPADICSYDDGMFEILTNMHWEWCSVPYSNPENDAYSRGDGRACIVYIQHFTTDRIDFAYYIQDTENLSSFFAGTFGRPAYAAPLFATPIVICGRERLLSGQHVCRKTPGTESRVCKNGAQTERVRWRCM
jgi:hypothetical protein